MDHKWTIPEDLISGSHFLTSQMQKRLRLSIFWSSRQLCHIFYSASQTLALFSKCNAAKKIQSIVGGLSLDRFSTSLSRTRVLGKPTKLSLTHASHISPQGLERHYWEISWLHLQQGRFTFAINHRPGKMSKHCTNVHAIHKLSCQDFGLYTNNNKKIKTTTNIWRVQPACSSHL